MDHFRSLKPLEEAQYDIQGAGAGHPQKFADLESEALQKQFRVTYNADLRFFERIGLPEARAAGARVLFCLSTQAFNYFQQKGGFTQATPDDLPPARRDRYDKSGRRSLVLLKKLA